MTAQQIAAIRREIRWERSTHTMTIRRLLNALDSQNGLIADILAVASGELQVVDNDTDALNWIQKRIESSSASPTELKQAIGG